MLHSTWPTAVIMSDVEKGSRRLDLIQLRDLCAVLGYRLPQFVNEYEEARRRQSETIHNTRNQTSSGLLWNGKTLSNWSTAHMKRQKCASEVPINVAIFASHMSSSYVSVEWVARQLGLWCASTMIAEYRRTLIV
jgi:hypothetical protein